MSRVELSVPDYREGYGKGYILGLQLALNSRCEGCGLAIEWVMTDPDPDGPGWVGWCDCEDRRWSMSVADVRVDFYNGEA